MSRRSLIHSLDRCKSFETFLELNLDKFGSFLTPVRSKKAPHLGILIFRHIQCYLKLVSANFSQILFFTSNDSPSKTAKNVFYFI